MARARILIDDEARLAADDQGGIDTAQMPADEFTRAALQHQEAQGLWQDDEENGREKQRQHATDHKHRLPAMGGNERGGNKTGSDRTQDESRQHDGNHKETDKIRQSMTCRTGGTIDFTSFTTGQLLACRELEEFHHGASWTT